MVSRSWFCFCSQRLTLSPRSSSLSFWKLPRSTYSVESITNSPVKLWIYGVARLGGVRDSRFPEAAESVTIQIYHTFSPGIYDETHPTNPNEKVWYIWICYPLLAKPLDSNLRKRFSFLCIFNFKSTQVWIERFVWKKWIKTKVVAPGIMNSRCYCTVLNLLTILCTALNERIRFGRLTLLRWSGLDIEYFL